MKSGLSLCSWSTRRFLGVPLITRIFLPRKAWDLVSRTCHLAAFTSQVSLLKARQVFPFMRSLPASRARSPRWQGTRWGVGVCSTVAAGPWAQKRWLLVTWGTLKDPRFYEPWRKSEDKEPSAPMLLREDAKHWGSPEKTDLTQILQVPVLALSSLFSWKTDSKNCKEVQLDVLPVPWKVRGCSRPLSV